MHSQSNTFNPQEDAMQVSDLAWIVGFKNGALAKLTKGPKLGGALDLHWKVLVEIFTFSPTCPAACDGSETPKGMIWLLTYDLVIQPCLVYIWYNIWNEIVTLRCVSISKRL